MWEVLSFADKPYKGLSKAKVNNSTWFYKLWSLWLGKARVGMVLLRWWLSKKWWLASGNILRKVKERLKTSNYMMEAPTNYLRHNKKSWTAAYQVTTFFSIDLQKIWSSRDVDCEFYELTILARMAIKADRWWLTVGLGSHELDLLFHT